MPGSRKTKRNETTRQQVPPPLAPCTLVVDRTKSPEHHEVDDVPVGITDVVTYDLNM